MSTVRNTLVLALVAVLTAGCAVTFTQEPGGNGALGIQTADQREPVINRFLDVRAFPGSRIVETSFDDRDSETRFEVSASLEVVYRHFHEELVATDWRRMSLVTESDEIEATYIRGSLELELDLDVEAPGLFELELDVD